MADFDKKRRIMWKRRVHPEPSISTLVRQEFEPKDKVAPWSKPRGYDTTILEEAYAYKAAIREMRRREAAAAVPVAVKPKPRVKKTRSWHIRNLLPIIDVDLRFKERLTRFIGTLFCIRVETEAYIQSVKS
jgi:hypothetical protein